MTEQVGVVDVRHTDEQPVLSVDVLQQISVAHQALLDVVEALKSTDAVVLGHLAESADEPEWKWLKDLVLEEMRLRYLAQVSVRPVVH